MLRRKKLDELSGRVSDEVSDVAARAQNAMDDARNGVRAAVRDTMRIVGNEFSRQSA